ncbi:MAG: GNAT family N-acyltransferase [Gammaproteobacteria bacterium]|nr:GNAT family N-acyltransferase [Gammaproteobacteria bacterium]
MSVLSNQASGNKEIVFTAHIANSGSEILECQKLRYKVFAGEMGAVIKTDVPGVDKDYFDEYCLHLYVRNNETGQVIATTRVLNSENAKLSGKYYSESEFDLNNITCLDGTFLEIGRTCVLGEYRTGAAINALWQCVAKVMAESKADYLFGCYSIPLSDSGRYVGALMNYVKTKYYAPEKYRVTPKLPIVTGKVSNKLDVVMPSLLKRYLNMGAYVCGEPCLDKDFNTADLFILLDKKQMTKRYVRHFLSTKG